MSDDTVTCRECDRKFGMITHTHLKTHDMSTRDYQKEHPDAPFFSDEVNKRRGKSLSERDTPWLEGENNHAKNPNVRQKISESRKGLVYDLDDHPAWERKRVEVTCEVCGTVKEYIPSLAEKRRFCSLQCAGVAHRGENNPMYGSTPWNYKGGVSFEPYGEDFTDELKDIIRRRDGYECFICGLPRQVIQMIHGWKLDVHHVDEDKTNNTPGNLLTVCRTCHVNWHRNMERGTFGVYND